MPTVAQLQRALAADPSDPFLHYAFAQELSKAGAASLDPAIEAYDRCLALDPSYCYAYFHKAKVLEQLGRLDDAKATLTVGVAKAKQAADGKALSELAVYLDSLS